MNKYRKIRRGRAKDYERDAKYYYYYYIVVNNKSYTIGLNGWNNRLEVLKDLIGDEYVIVDNRAYYLKGKDEVMK